MNLGHQLKEHGQQVALLNSGPDWTSYILDKLRAFCKARKELGMPVFRWEEFREVAVKSGWDAPHSPNAYGALPRLACREGLIEFTGQYENAKSPKTHSHPVKVWRAL